MSSYVVGVVSHIDREEQRVRLRDSVQPDLIQVDDGTRGAMVNHLDTLTILWLHGKAFGVDWIVVLEDDAMPVPDFHYQLNMALDVAPSPIVSLYNGTGYPAQRQRKFMDAVTTGACWIIHPQMRHAVGYALRAECFELGVIDHMTELSRKGWAPDDALGSFARRQGLPVAYTNPSLVDHEDGRAVITNRTHLGHATFGRKRPRKAHHVGGRLTWDDTSVTV